MKSIHLNKIAAIAEEKTLRVLMTSSVNGLEFFIGSILPVFLVTVFLNYALMPISGFIITGANLVLFSVVTIIASLISCIIGMLLGIFAKNQVSAGTLITPVLLILLIVPMFSDFIDGLSFVSQFVFTGIIMNMTMNISSHADTILNMSSIIIMVIEAILAVFLFIVFYMKNGFEKD